MNYLITESQLSIIAESVGGPRIMESVRKLNSFSSKIISRVSKKYNLNVRLLLTWGPSMGGLVMPLDNFIRTGNFNLDDNQIALILCGVAGVIYYDNQEKFKDIVNKIKNEGLFDTFEIVLERAKDLQYVFSTFIQSLGTSVNSIGDILSYAFLIPIVPDLAAFFARSQNSEKTIILIGQRLVASGLILIAADIIVEMLKRIRKRFV